MVTYAKISPKIVNPSDSAGNTEEEEGNISATCKVSLRDGSAQTFSMRSLPETEAADRTCYLIVTVKTTPSMIMTRLKVT